MVTSDFRTEVKVRPFRAFAVKMCNTTLICSRIDKISATLREICVTECDGDIKITPTPNMIAQIYVQMNHRVHYYPYQLYTIQLR